MKFMVLIFLLSPLACLGDDVILPKIKKIGEYTAIITFSPESVSGTLTIKKGEKIVYEEKDFNPYNFGLDENKDNFSGKNITGNKIPNLVVSQWWGGTSCCYRILIFELGKEFRKIIEFEAYAGRFDLINLDKSKDLEIEIGDGSTRGEFTSSAHTAYGRVVMKFIDKDYRVAADLMRKTRPSKKNILKFKTQIIEAFKKNDGPDLPAEFLEIMMDLSYSGHLDLALQIAEETWIQNKDGFETLETFKKKFVDCLNESSYWRAFSDALDKEKTIKK